jgi:DNA polymerase/3'-5' exonuclease PolX
VKLKQKKLFGTDEAQVCDKIPLSTAKALAEQVLSCVSPFLNPVAVVGSVRRGKPYCKDIDFVGVGSMEKAVMAVRQKFVLEFKVKGDKVTKFYITTEHGKVQVDLYCATPKTFGIHKLIRTGSAEHNMWLASYAMSKGFRLKYSGGLLKDGVVVAGEKEEGVFEALGLKCPEPSKREVVDGKPIEQL